jgi:hypothetical protein
VQLLKKFFSTVMVLQQIKKACPKKGWPLLTYEKHRYKNRRKNTYANFKLFNFFKYNKVTVSLFKKEQLKS